MAKNNFLSWDTTANSNTDIGGVNIAELCAPSGINNAIRTMMAQLRADIDNGVVYAAKATNYTALATDNNAVLRFTAASTLSLTAAATLATDWHITVIADGGDVTIDPNASETIDGATTLIVPNGSSERIICNGTAFFTERKLQPFATIASASTTDLSTVGSENVTVTGTTTITGLGTAPAGTFRRLLFSGSLLLTYNATSLILPGSKNITTLAGDVAEAISLGSGNWRITSFVPEIGWKTLYDDSFTTQANLDVVTGVSVCRLIRIAGSITVSTATGFGIRLSVDSGATYKSAAADYTRDYHYFSNGAVATAEETGNMIFLNAGENINPAYTFTFTATFDNTSVGTLVGIECKGTYRGNTSGKLFDASVFGQLGVANGPIGGIRFLPLAGTITGRILVEGLR